MRIIEPYPITPAMVTASNIPETDEPNWATGTTYTRGARVIRDHAIWESLQESNAGHDPSLDTAAAWWVRLGATNRWRAFDDRLGGKVTGGASISYTIALPRTLNSLAIFGIAGQSVRVKITAPGAIVVYDETIDLATRLAVSNFWEYVYSPFEYKPDLILTGLPLASGAVLEVTIAASVAAEVGEIIIGNDVEIGTTLVDTSLGIVDYSKKDRDEWGGVYLVKRPATKTVRFRFVVPTDAASRVQQIVERITGKLVVFYAVAGEDPFGTTVAGVLRDYDLTLGATMSFGNIDAESMT